MDLRAMTIIAVTLVRTVATFNANAIGFMNVIRLSITSHPMLFFAIAGLVANGHFGGSDFLGPILASVCKWTVAARKAPPVDR